MNDLIKILMVEDTITDAELIHRELVRDGLNVESLRVETRGTYLSALEEFQPHLILSDFTMPLFDGLSALKIAHETYPDIPFIFVSGTIDEDIAIAALRGGAIDYVPKTNLKRLAPAVGRALDDVRMRLARKQAESRFRDLIEFAPNAIVVLNEHCKIEIVNACAETLFCYAREEMLGRPCETLIPELLKEFHNVIIKNEAEGLQGEPSVAFETNGRRKDGSQFPAEINLSQLKTESGLWVSSVIRDISERKAQEQRIARLSRIYAVLSGINSAIVRIHDRDKLFQEACRVAVKEGAFGMAWIGVIDRDTLDGRVVAWFGGEPGYEGKIKLTARADTPDSNRPACIAVREMKQVVCNDIAADQTLAVLKADLLARGHRSVAALPLIIDNQAVAVIVLYAEGVNCFDEQELRLLDELAGDLSFALQFIGKEEQLVYQAYYDTLTGLPNSRLFHDRLTQFLNVNKRDQSIIAVILFNLDHFSHLNDTLGRHAGDALLQQIAQRLEVSLQNTHSLARISGDTFAIAIPNLQHVADLATIIEQQIFEPLENTFIWKDQDVHISIRAGFALYPNDGLEAETLFKHAEVALKNAKSSGERYLYYAPEMNVVFATRMVLEKELQLALDGQQFELYYQPRVDVQSGQIVSAEALIRWRHPQRGLVPPIEFIPMAEETGLIVPIGAWVIDTVCAQQVAWLKQQVDIVSVAVNLSAVQFKNGKVLQTILGAINAHRIKQQYIEFELTESVVMGNPEEAKLTLNALKKLGIHLSLDDFGTGYSSLAYLKRFPFDFVKIDRSFITDVTINPEDAAITTAIIAIAHSLKLRVVAEGVETEGQLQFLRKLRCDEIQGYYFSPPVPAEAFAVMLRNGKHLAPSQELLENIDTLLIVDDAPNNLSTLVLLMQRENYHVLTAKNAQEGLNLLAVNNVQVIITDQRMSGMSGVEFLRIVTKLYPDTIRIILTEYTDIAAITDSVNRGVVFKFLTKPLDDTLLRENIRDAFRRYRLTV